MDDLERYIADHIPPEDSLLTALDRETHLRVIQPRMISGHLQGQLLKMLVQMISPQRILEIGTFTGYSAICMARGLQAGGEIHTIEIDDELEEIAAKYFREAEQNIQGRIIQHIGSALDLAPGLGTFDLIFIDGDKREYPQYYENGDALARPQRQLPVGRQHSLVRKSGGTDSCGRPFHRRHQTIQPHGNGRRQGRERHPSPT